MEPTLKLRQVWRVMTIRGYHRWIMNDATQTSLPMLITQQWWEGEELNPQKGHYELTGEWRDLEIEDDSNVSAGRPCGSPGGCNASNCLSCGEASRLYPTNTCGQAADIIERQAAEIERLKEWPERFWFLGTADECAIEWGNRGEKIERQAALLKTAKELLPRELPNNFIGMGKYYAEAAIKFAPPHESMSEHKRKWFMECAKALAAIEAWEKE